MQINEKMYENWRKFLDGFLKNVNNFIQKLCDNGERSSVEILEKKNLRIVS